MIITISFLFIELRITQLNEVAHLLLGQIMTIIVITMIDITNYDDNNNNYYYYWCCYYYHYYYYDYYYCIEGGTWPPKSSGKEDFFQELHTQRNICRKTNKNWFFRILISKYWFLIGGVNLFRAPQVKQIKIICLDYSGRPEDSWDNPEATSDRLFPAPAKAGECLGNLDFRWRWCQAK